jgi:hypothetical protein
MKATYSLLSLPLALVLGACGADTGQSALANASGDGDNGTRLSTGTSPGIVCQNDTTAQVTFSGTLLTTGSVSPVTITATIDGTALASDAGHLAPTDFVHNGRDKSAAYSVTLSLSNGTHTVVLCFTQPGANGRTTKQICTDAVTVAVDCTPDGGAPAPAPPPDDAGCAGCLCSASGTCGCDDTEGCSISHCTTSCSVCLSCRPG